MDLEKLTDRARGFLQAAQTIAVREHHQRITPAHYAKALLDDEQGMAAGLINAAGGDGAGGAARNRCTGRKAASRDRQRRDFRAGNRRRPHPPARPGAGDRDQGRRQLCHGRAHPAGDGAGQGHATSAQALAKAGVTPQALNAAIDKLRGGRTADTQGAEDRYDALKKYARDLTEAAREGKLDPVIGRDEEIRRTIQVLARRTKNNPGPDRRAGRRQDRDRRRPGAAHCQWRRARRPQGPAPAVARHGLADRRRQISRRVRGAAEGRARRGQAGRRARSSCSSTRCTRWSAPGKSKARWTRPT